MNKLNLLHLLFLLCGFTNLSAQVTIGSDIEPVKGAILDLKQTQTNDGSANSALGLMLPRVRLTDPNKLSGGAAITGVNDNSEADKSSYTGLTVYNIHVNESVCPGIYSWVGAQWMRQMPPCPPPPVYGKWAGSNVYFQATGGEDADGVTEGKLTFEEYKGDKEGYQGLFFKWGSLVGTAAGANEAWSIADTYVYIPDLATGKYYKVKTGRVTYLKNNTPQTAAGTIVKTFANASGISWSNGSWASIPYTNGTDIDATGAGRGDDRLTTNTETLKARYKGDICRFLTITQATNGNSSFDKKWKMPISYDFGISSDYSGYTSGGIAGDVDGVGGNLGTCVYTYTDTNPMNPTGTSRFSVSGGRAYDGQVYSVGANGYLWTSSTAGADLRFIWTGSTSWSEASNSGDAGRPVRCVRD